MTKIFPQTSSRRRSAPKSNYPDNDSNLIKKNCNGYVQINYKLVRHCLIYGSINEKCEVLDAIRLVSCVINNTESMCQLFFLENEII